MTFMPRSKVLAHRWYYREFCDPRKFASSLRTSFFSLGNRELYYVNFAFKADGGNNGDTKTNTKHLLWQALLVGIYCVFPPIFP